jgi:hypothetical protein
MVDSPRTECLVLNILKIWKLQRDAVNSDEAEHVADNIGEGDVQLAAVEAELDAGDSTTDAAMTRCWAAGGARETTVFGTLFSGAFALGWIDPVSAFSYHQSYLLARNLQVSFVSQMGLESKSE